MCYSILFLTCFVCLCYYNVQIPRFSSFYDAIYAAGDSMSNGIYFSTKDNDNDNRHAYSPYSGSGCAENLIGAWWYDNCGGANLNGKYYDHGFEVLAYCVQWDSWLGYRFSLQRTEMKIRPQ